MQVRNDHAGGRGAWPFDRQFYLILNLAIGGSWASGKKGVNDAALPQRFEVDYVRVWSLPAGETWPPTSARTIAPTYRLSGT
jgi:hypothetical protein